MMFPTLVMVKILKSHRIICILFDLLSCEIHTAYLVHFISGERVLTWSPGFLISVAKSS